MLILLFSGVVSSLYVRTASYFIILSVSICKEKQGRRKQMKN